MIISGIKFPMYSLRHIMRDDGSADAIQWLIIIQYSTRSYPIILEYDDETARNVAGKI